MKRSFHAFLLCLLKGKNHLFVFGNQRFLIYKINEIFNIGKISVPFLLIRLSYYIYIKKENK